MAKSPFRASHSYHLINLNMLLCSVFLYLVPRLHCCYDFTTTDDPYHAQRHSFTVSAGFSCLRLSELPYTFLHCSVLTPVGRDSSAPLFSTKKLQKMRPSTFNHLKDLRVKIVQGGMMREQEAG